MKASSATLKVLARELALSQSALSHPLRILRPQEMMTQRREGHDAYDKLADESPMDVVRACLKTLQLKRF